VVDSAWVALSLIDQIGGVRLRALVASFGSARDVLRASPNALRTVRGIGAVTAAAIVAIDLAAVEAKIVRWQQQDIRLITLLDPDYPTRLAQVADAPPTLFVRGIWQPAAINGDVVAIVGTRQPSLRAERETAALAASYAHDGWTVVSGLARGIDSIAHRNALAAANTPTLAVLGGGVLPGAIYPPEHRPLAEDIARGGGALVSEQPPHADSKPAYLVARNRILTGLSRRVVVVETAVDGGAMHAARRALEQGREVYTFDLPASGNQQLIEEGARVI
jgi:DNA processing protein